MLKQASLITALVVTAAIAAGPLWPVSSAGAQDDRIIPNIETALSSEKQAILDAHNRERAEFGSEPLRWSPRLALAAEDWAEELAAQNDMKHASSEQRGGAGENLWIGTKGRYRAVQIIGSFVDERKHFKSGAFPDVSKTGKWADVGHYTQLVWPQTKQVGCAIATGENDDFLVCRYWPAGNRYGIEISSKRAEKTSAPVSRNKS